jgi:hypothetical protein
MTPVSRAARPQDILGKTMRTKTAEKNLTSSQLAGRCMATYDRLLAETQSILYTMESEPVGEGSSG